MEEPHLASAEFGGFWIRFVAVLADSAILFVVMLLILVGGVTALGEDGAAMAGLAAWLFTFLYWPVMHASGMQATLGKAMLGLRVTGYQGNRISFLRALGRELSKILSGAVLMVGYLVAGFTARKQALHDLVASTYVVRQGKPRIVAALATAVAGFLLPVVVAVLGVGGPMVGTLMTMAMNMEQQPPARPQPTMKVAPPPPMVVAAPQPQPAAPLPAQPVPVTPVPIVEKPVPVAEKPVVVPEPVVVAAPPQPSTPVIEPKRIETKKTAPKKAAPKKLVALKTPAKAPAVFEPKAPPGPKFNDLMTAVLYRDAAAVSELLKFGRWADKPDSRGTTPLMLAVELGDAASAEVLLKGGADPGRAMSVAQARRDGPMLDLLKRYAAR